MTNGRPLLFGVLAIGFLLTVVIPFLSSVLSNASKSELAHEAYAYGPPGSHVRVTFESTPQTMTLHVPSADGALLSGERAEVIFPDGSFQRAEHIPVPDAILALIDEPTALADMQQYADAQGIDVNEMFYSESYLGRTGRMRGYKVLIDHYGEPFHATFEMHVYYGINSTMILYTGSPSPVYPTAPIARFLSSVSAN